MYEECLVASITQNWVGRAQQDLQYSGFLSANLGICDHAARHQSQNLVEVQCDHAMHCIANSPKRSLMMTNIMTAVALGNATEHAAELMYKGSETASPR